MDPPISVKTLEELERLAPKKLYLQVPEGLKTRALDIASFLEGRGFGVVVGCDPCYGACDLRGREAEALGCDLLLHIGHSDFGAPSEVPVLYEEYHIGFDPVPLLEKHLDALRGFRKIALLTTVQFLGSLKAAKGFLEGKGKEVLLAQNAGGVEGVLLGCDQSAALKLEADCYLFLGSGKFHPLGLVMKTSKPVLSLDFESRELRDFSQEKRRAEKIRAFHLAQARESERFGILVSTKPGQLFPGRAWKAKESLESKGKKAWILAMDELSPTKLEGMVLEVLVDCACPRIMEDAQLFKKPVIGPEDTESL